MSFYDPNQGPPTPPPEFTDLYLLAMIPGMIAVLMLINTMFGILGIAGFVMLWLKMCDLFEKED